MAKKELIQVADSLYDRIAELIEQSRQYVKTTVNTAMVYTYYNVGRYIVEDEQHGKERAAYGESVLKELSAKLTTNFGAGWSLPHLKRTKQFYLAYAKRLNTVEPIQSEKAQHCLANSQFILSWSTTTAILS